MELRNAIDTASQLKLTTEMLEKERIAHAETERTWRELTRDSAGAAEEIEMLRRELDISKAEHQKMVQAMEQQMAR